MLWQPAFFGVRPSLVIKGGMIAYAAMGDANASIPTPQPVLPRPMFGADAGDGGGDVGALRRAAGVDGGPRRPAGRAAAAGAGAGHARGSPRRTCRDNDALPRIEVEPDTFTVRVDGEVVEAAPAVELPMAQRYFLF